MSLEDSLARCTVSNLLGKNTIIIIRATLITDSRDNTLYRDWDNTTQTVVKNCMVEPFPMAEKLNFEDSRDREFARSACRFYLPRDTDIVYTDRILFDTFEWQVLGHPGIWYDFKAFRHHKTAIGQIRLG